LAYQLIGQITLVAVAIQITGMNNNTDSNTLIDESLTARCTD